MQSIKIKYLTSFIAVISVGCTQSMDDEMYGRGFVIVDKKTWADKYDTSYPLTVSSGEISHSSYS